MTEQEFYHQCKFASIMEFAEMADEYTLHSVLTAADATIENGQMKQASHMDLEDEIATAAATAVAMELSKVASDLIYSGNYEPEEYDYALLEDAIEKVARQARDEKEEQSRFQRAKSWAKQNPGKALAGTALTAAGIYGAQKGGRAAWNSELGKDLREGASQYSAERSLQRQRHGSKMRNLRKKYVGAITDYAKNRGAQAANDLARGAGQTYGEARDAYGVLRGQFDEGAKNPQSNLQLTEDDVFDSLEILKVAGLIDDDIIETLLDSE